MVRAAKGRQVNPTSECAAKKRAGKGEDRVIRGFLTGLVWGGVVAGAGLAVISQVAPLPQPAQMAQPDPIPTPTEPPPSEDAAPQTPEPATPEPPASQDTAAPAPDLQPEILQKVPDPAPEPTPAPDTAPADVESPPETLPLIAPQGVEDAAPAAPVSPAPVDTAQPALPQTQDSLALAPQADLPTPPQPEPAPAPATPPPAPGDSLLQPAPPATEAPADPAAPIQILPQDPAPAPEPQVLVPDAGALPQNAPGVTTDRLPRIGDPEPPADAMAEGEAPAEVAPELALTGTTPLELFARPFDNPDNLPLFSILLVDDGIDLEDRQRLANLPFPVTFALDPLAPGAAEAAAVYRAAGQEVAMIASGIPAGATAADMEQTFQALDMALPEAVVVLDRRDGGFQQALDLARQAVPIVAEQGRGIVTYDLGLNSADQVARREGVPRATIFRILDAEGESIPKMRNYLDRAAFKAAQEGRVVVIGMASPETVAAILEWTVEGRASSVALAPISAALRIEPSN